MATVSILFVFLCFLTIMVTSQNRINNRSCRTALENAMDCCGSKLRLLRKTSLQNCQIKRGQNDDDDDTGTPEAPKQLILPYKANIARKMLNRHGLDAQKGREKRDAANVQGNKAAQNDIHPCTLECVFKEQNFLLPNGNIDVNAVIAALPNDFSPFFRTTLESTVKECAFNVSKVDMSEAPKFPCKFTSKMFMQCLRRVFISKCPNKPEIPGKSCSALIKRVEWCNPFMLPTVVFINGQQGQQGSPGQQGSRPQRKKVMTFKQQDADQDDDQGDSDDDISIPQSGPTLKPNLMIFRYDKNNPPIFAKTPKKTILGDEMLENAGEK